MDGLNDFNEWAPKWPPLVIETPRARIRLGQSACISVVSSLTDSDTMDQKRQRLPNSSLQYRDNLEFNPRRHVALACEIRRLLQGHRGTSGLDNMECGRIARVSFDHYFGTDDTNLLAWQDLCWYCGKKATKKDPMFKTIAECRRFLYGRHINIFDLIHHIDLFTIRCNHAAEAGLTMPAYEPPSQHFKNSRMSLAWYSRRKGLVCPAEVGHGNNLFRFMLTRWSD